MTNQIRVSDLEDPLDGYSGLSLFPRTFASLPNPPKPYDPDDPLYGHNFLKSMPLGSSNELLEQAKAIVDSSSEFLNPEKQSDLVSKDINEVIAANVMENPQERRPALGRKRARFSLKPNTRQPTVSVEPSMDIDKLKDPEEFFLAFEKHENAKRELQKHTGGVLMDANQFNPSNAARPRRPGILGRSVKYKHHYSTAMSSQETIEESVLSPSDRSSQQETTILTVELQERELAGSISKGENRVNELLDELLTGNYEELDGDGTVTLLQEQLQIKPIDLEKLRLPNMQDIRRIDLKASGEKLRKPRSALSDIQNLLKGISSKTPLKHRQAESSVHSLASPTPPKSAFASISLLRKHILQSNSLHDPFSALNIDQSLARNASPIESIDKSSDHIDSGKELSVSGKFKSLIFEENDIAAANSSSPKMATRNFTGPSEKSVNDNLSILETGIDVGSSASHADKEDKIEGVMDNRVTNDNLSRPDADTVVRENALNEQSHEVRDMLQEAMASAQSDLNMEDSTVEKLNNIQSQLDKSSTAVVEDHPMDGPTAESAAEHHNEKVQESSRLPLNKQSKAISRPRKESKIKGLSRRQSLAGSGTSWESGVRRSTRIRSRPLEYWKGEKFLYGRIHESLATVIGIKYESPGKTDGKPAIKVKSYVSDEYKDMIELAARH